MSQEENKYRLERDYEHPCGRIHKGTVKAVRQWLVTFPLLVDEDNIRTKTDWFSLALEYPKELLPERIEISELMDNSGHNPEYWYQFNCKIIIPQDKFPQIKSAIEYILNDDAKGYWETMDKLYKPETNPSTTYTEPVDTFDWQNSLAGITGTILGLKKVCMDLDISDVKSIGHDLGLVSDEITQVISSMKTANLKPPYTEQSDIFDGSKTGRNIVDEASQWDIPTRKFGTEEINAALKAFQNQPLQFYSSKKYTQKELEEEKEKAFYAARETNADIHQKFKTFSDYKNNKA